MPRAITPLSELPLSNDFMFCEVMRQPEVCKLFLEALLETDIARIEYITKQEDLADDFLSHGIRLDVYLNDAKGTRYNIEMQKTNRGCLMRRIRYYQSGIDRRFLEKNADYEQLPESYVIFVCDFDCYQAGLACYERVSHIKGRDDLNYDDGSHVLILNSRYQTPNTSQPMLEFLDYIRTNNDTQQPASTLAQKTIQAVHHIRYDKSKEVPYMTYTMKLRDALEEGREEGREQGREEGREQGREEGIRALIMALRQLSIAPEVILQQLESAFGLSPQAAQEKLAQYGDC